MSSLISENAHVSVFVTTTSERDALLEDAVERVRVAAPDNRSRGVLVTARAPGAFEVNLSDQVPHGFTLERYAY